ncbi:MAG: hypothetical protein WDO56_01130 [Gammaproteobacteria bacterium]
MIATGHLVFLHLHKSGGTFVNEGLLRFVPDARIIGYHLPRKLIPPSLAHLPVVGLVRNPWSYYVSWYSFQARRPQPNPLFRVLSEDGQLGFDATVRNMLDLGSGGSHLDGLVAALPKEYTHRGVNLPGHVLEGIRESRLGFYAWLYRYIYDGPGITYIGRMERMREELVPMLAAAGQPMNDALRSYILEAPSSNVSEHAPYTEYYTADLAKLVAARDASLIERFGYRFGD